MGNPQFDHKGINVFYPRLRGSSRASNFHGAGNGRHRVWLSAHRPSVSLRAFSDWPILGVRGVAGGEWENDFSRDSPTLACAGLAKLRKSQQQLFFFPHGLGWRSGLLERLMG